MQHPRSTASALVTGILAALCCVGLAALGTGGYFFYKAYSLVRDSGVTEFIFDASTPTAEPVVVRPSQEPESLETIDILAAAVIPPRDLADLACRFDGKCSVPETLPPPAAPRHAGETDSFWVSNFSTNEMFRVQAVLRYVTPHVYFWVEEGVNYDLAELTALVDTFEHQIYPTTRAFFGSEWTPGIDGDEHIYILYAGGAGFSIAGYFSAADEIHPLIHEYSNAHEMFLLNSDTIDLGDELTYGVLAHEFQHMIRWKQDRDETTWMNEGFSEVAAFFNGYDHSGFDRLYISNPDLQLNDWPNKKNATLPHYGCGFLYLTYFLDRFGEHAARKLAQEQANGFDAMENVLRAINAREPLSGQPITADDFFMDWAITNFLLDPSLGDGRYVYRNYPQAHRASATEAIHTCPQDAITRGVHQYGVDYIAIECAGDYTLTFTGSTVVPLLPVDPYSGKYAFWSNKDNESDMTLTREFDFTNVSGPITLSYQTWYDLESDYDYVYLEASEDGERWQILATPAGTPDDPAGSSYGWAYNGMSNGWIREDVDLSQYAGKKVFVRFEYITDQAVNGEGFLLDDVSIEAVNYGSDFEADDGGWVANGFVRIQNVLPQTFRLALIQSSDSSVKMIPLDHTQTAEISISLKAGEKAVLVITGTTRYTRERASYQIEIR